MEIEVTISEDDRGRLREAFGGRDPDVVAQLVAKAGTIELIEQATGRTVPTSMADLRAFRIYCLLAQGLDLTEAESYVMALFKVPTATAKRLVNGAVARYQVELQVRVKGLVTQLLESANWVGNALRWHVTIPSVFVRERIATSLEQLDLPDPVPAQRGPVWAFPDETYQALRKAFSLKPKAVPNK